MMKETYERSQLRITRFGEDSIHTDVPLITSGNVSDGAKFLTKGSAWAPTPEMTGGRESGAGL